MIVGDVTVDPATVILSGAKGVLSGLDSIETVEDFIEGVTDSFSTTVALDLSNLRTVTSEVTEVTISGRIEQYVEFELGEIPIRLKGRLRREFTVTPDLIQIVVIGPVSLIQTLREEEVDVYIEINDPPIGKTYYSPMIELPDGIELLSEQPKLFKAIRIGETSDRPVESLISEVKP